MELESGWPIPKTAAGKAMRTDGAGN